MLIEPGPIRFEGFSFVIDEAESGGVVDGPWNTELLLALEALAADPSSANRAATEVALAQWLAEWNGSLGQW